MGSTMAYKRGPKKSEAAKLTDRARKFAEEYVVDLEGRAAAIRAGYAPKSAAVVACNLLKHPVVRQMIGVAQHKATQKLGLDREHVLDKLACNLHRTGIRNLSKDGIVVSSLDDIPDEAFAYIDGFEVTQTFGEGGKVVGQKIKIKLSPNAQAQDMAMKHIGAYAAEKHQFVGKAVIDYEALSKPAEVGAIDAVSARLLEEEGKYAKGTA